MSSKRNSGAHGGSVAGGIDDDASLIGWGSGFRLAVCYVGFFTVVCGVLFGITYIGVSQALREREYEIVRNRATEYRAWFNSGHLEMLEARIEEQSLQTGDVVFVHVAGPRLDYIKFHSPTGGSLPLDELRRISPSQEGANVEIGGENWAIASLPVGDRGIVLQVGKNASSTEQVLAQLRKLYAFTLIPAALIAMLGGAMLTYRAMAPIRRLTVTIREILRAGDLGQRAEPHAGSNELNALVGLFNRLLARNETLIEAMHQSLDGVAHDMRTPLSRLNNTAETALGKGNDPELLRDALADCVEESENVGRLLTTLMDVAEAESGAMRLSLERLSLPEVVAKVIELYEFVSEEKSIRVEAEMPDELSLCADRTRLSQALANLLDNAIKYSPESSTVHVRVSSEDGKVAIAVCDEGIGISETDLPHVWDRLFRAERSRTAHGMGLGLSFVRAIVEAHGGSVECESEVNRGSTFTVSLPLDQQAAAAGGAEPP